MNFKMMTETKWHAGKSSLILVLQGHAVDAVWLKQSLLGPSIHLMERFDWDEQTPAKVAQRVAEIGKTPARVLLCLPRSMVIQRRLVYPAAVQNDLAQMLQFEAARHVPIPEEDRRIAFSSVLSSDGRQVCVNLLAARNSDLAALLAPWSHAGIPVDEVLPLSALLAPPDGGAPVLFVFSDDEQVELALYANGLLQDTQLIDRPAGGFGKETLVDAARRLTVRHRETLGVEGVGKVISAGPVDLSDETRSGFEVTFGLHVQALELPETLQPAVAAVPDSPVLTEALCAVFAEPPPTLNLIERSDRKVPLSRRTLLISGLCALMVAELLIGWLVWLAAPVIALKSAEREADDLKRRSAAIQAVKTQNREMRNELAQLTEMGKTRMSLMEMLKVLSDTFPEDTYLREFTYVRGDEIQMKGRSKKPDQLPQLLLNLPFVSTIEKSGTGEKTDEYFSFDLTAALRSTSHE